MQKYESLFPIIAPFGFAGGHLPLENGVKNCKLFEQQASSCNLAIESLAGRRVTGRSAIFASFVSGQKKAQRQRYPLISEFLFLFLKEKFRRLDEVQPEDICCG